MPKFHQIGLFFEVENDHEILVDKQVGHMQQQTEHLIQFPIDKISSALLQACTSFARLATGRGRSKKQVKYAGSTDGIPFRSHNNSLYAMLIAVYDSLLHVLRDDLMTKVSLVQENAMMKVD